ncbi:MAG: DNA polymerase I [Erysipelotrichaceae bacterium]|nr:DNA polymerase I [Erysipelotrichaceae bacterium]
MKKMLLIDGNSMVFRAYYATAYGRPMTTGNGISTNALYGFVMMISKALELIAPDAVLVAFDTEKKTFRHEIYAEYKGTRKPAPAELIVQFPLVREYLDALNVTRFELAGKEADDIIGSLAKQYPDWDTNILTSDHDLLQLIDETTSVWLMKKGLTEIEEMTLASLQEKMGITPAQIIDLKALMGDSSDNIPGIPNVGEKTALKLLSEYQTVENVLLNAEHIKGKLGENIRNNQHLALLSKQLATIDCQMEIPLKAEDLTFERDNRKLYRFFLKYEMNSFLKNVDDNDAVQQGANPVDYRTVNQVPHRLLKDDTALYLDYDFKNYYFAHLYGIALADTESVVYIRSEDIINDVALLTWLKSMDRKIVYDAKAAYHLLNELDVPLDGIAFDIQLAAFLIDNLMNDWDKLYNKYQLQTSDLQIMIYGTEGRITLPDESLQVKHACERAHDIFYLYPLMKKTIDELEMNELYYDVELPLTAVLYGMESSGIRIDSQVLDEIASKTLLKVNQLTEQIYLDAGQPFNINSPKQLAEILFDKLQLPANKKRSTAIDILERLLGRHPIIEHLMEYRKCQKLYSTYAEGLKKFISADHKIHTIFNQTVAQTGRLSSTEPNLQNISIRDEDGKEIRKAFIPEPGCILVSADYSQVEIRILAHMANERKLIQTFIDHEDIHTQTAMEVFGVAREDVTSSMRRQAKAVNFGIVYGISDFGLSQQLQIDMKTAQGYIDRYFASYPGIRIFMDEVVQFCQTNGYVRTLLNRRRYIPEINDKNYMTREFGKRAAMNAPIQGTAADLIKLAMVNIAKAIKAKNYQSQMILQVHDELIFNVTPDELADMKVLIEKEMEHAMILNVPLEAKCVQGYNWYDAK